MGNTRGPYKAGKRLEAILMETPHATIPELSKASGASRPTIVRTRNRLVRAGRIPPPINTQLKGLVEYPVHADLAEEREQKLSIIKDKTRYSLQDMEAVLTDILKGTTQARDAAVLARVIGVLKSQMGEKREVGPGVPLKDFQRVQRLALLMRACEKQEVRDAWKQAYAGEAPLDASGGLPGRAGEEAGGDALLPIVGEA